MRPHSSIMRGFVYEGQRLLVVAGWGVPEVAMPRAEYASTRGRRRRRRRGARIHRGGRGLRWTRFEMMLFAVAKVEKITLSGALGAAAAWYYIVLCSFM